MKVLVIGSGGREHALVWKIAQSPLVDKVYCAPGNAGICQMAECVDLPVSDFDALLRFAQRKRIDLTVVGPEAPLVAGIADLFRAHGLLVFGPDRQAAEIEGSKAFAKYLMDRYGVPTADCVVFSDPEEALSYAQREPLPMVVKADGLAAGKGSIVCRTRQEAVQAVQQIMVDRIFGEAGSKVVIEEYLEGEEASILAITDGERMVILPPSQDHKPIYDGDKGPNTGGMGAYCPAPVVDRTVLERVRIEILEPTIRGMAQEGRPYRGCLYAGLMITSEGPKVVEFNCRFGDPETQAVLPAIDEDLVPLLQGAAAGNLPTQGVLEAKRWAVCVVMASGGYPGPYEKGKVIHGLDRSFPNDVIIFHAGTRREKDQLLTDGGRVLGVTGLGSSVTEAIERAYWAVGKIAFDGAYYRKDIGQKAVRRLQNMARNRRA
ncbi:MAG: phosphoribosylamine--glycine ligase [candidate division KSB1 bacterium]|nr:phosphoribosylamine--glycine ligase [candidate division KSB1 bacterium]